MRFIEGEVISADQFRRDFQPEATPAFQDAGFGDLDDYLTPCRCQAYPSREVEQTAFLKDKVGW